MIFQGIDFHNVVEMTPDGNGWRAWRIPKVLAETIGKESNAYKGTGVELRFRIPQGVEAVTLHLEAEAADEAQVACIYYGSFAGGWSSSTRILETRDTAITIPRSPNTEALRAIARDHKMPFDPELVRVLLPYCRWKFLGIEGEVEPPLPTDTPASTYLAYGSSITHGSLALLPPFAYPFRVAERFGVDYLDQGYAGAAFLEREMAEHIVSRKDWDFASVEMGINIIGLWDELGEDGIEERVDTFTRILAEDGRPVFATSIYAFNETGWNLQEHAHTFRAMARKYAGERLRFVEGLDILDRRELISEDLIHPSSEGIRQIALGWGDFIESSGVVPVKS